MDIIPLITLINPISVVEYLTHPEGSRGNLDFFEDFFSMRASEKLYFEASETKYPKHLSNKKAFH